MTRFSMSLRILLVALVAGLATAAQAASSVQLLTPQAMSVAGGETKLFSVRFFDALGQPSAGETARFSNDACGRFPNGGFFMDTATDVTGVATLAFTALNPGGITCSLDVAAGVQAHFDVLTYQSAGVTISATTLPAAPLAGQPYTLAVSARFGAYLLRNVDVGARVIAGTASAELSAATLSTGNAGVAQFQVRPDSRLGGYEIEASFGGHAQRIEMAMLANALQDMWWVGSSENGWGMSIAQHPSSGLFFVIYAYDAAGKPTWFVMPDGAWNFEGTSIAGAVYSPRGSPYSAYDASRFVPGTPVGNVTLAFTDSNNATLDYTIAGVSGHKEIVREVFAPVDVTPTPSVGDMYWGGPSQDGWGISVMQQHRLLFGMWYTYDANGAPTWYAMPQGSWMDAATWVGPIYRTTGSPWLGAAYDPSKLEVFEVGGFQMRFTAEGATFDYVVDGKDGTMALVQLPF
jgi:hypothetical protein